MIAATSSRNRDLSPPPRTYLETKFVARRVACPNGTPIRKKSLVFTKRLKTRKYESARPHNVKTSFNRGFGLSRIVSH